MWYKRYYEDQFDDYLTPGKVFVLYGPRRVGKTSLIQHFLSSYNGAYFIGSGEDLILGELFGSQDIRRLHSAFAKYSLVIIDEGQYIPNIGLGLKLLVDNRPDLKVIASGSSSFELANKLGEPLTGRQRVGILFPLSLLELDSAFGGAGILLRLQEFMRFGTYPEILNIQSEQDRMEYLISLRDSYLFKDLLILENVKSASLLFNLLKLLAFQIGKEVSLSELSRSLGIAKHTVERYLDLLEKVFVLIKVSGFSRNLRKEVAKTCRYYFWDNGIRNAVINNFSPLDSRSDTGMLWENLLFIERLKRNSYKRHFANYYFWRTYDRQEIDFVEEYNGELWGYEFKWSDRPAKAPKAWSQTYPEAHFETIHRGNFLSFVTQK